MKKAFWFFIAFLALLLIAFNVYYNVIKIGLTIRESGIVLEYAFYVVSALLFYFLILEPLFFILFSKPYSVSKIITEKNIKYSFLVKLAQNLIKNKDLSEDNITALKDIIKSNSKDKKKKLANKLYILYNNQIKDIINKEIELKAKNTLYCTAISQSGFVDSLIVLVNNFRMVKRIVIICGFRPKFIRTMKLYVNMFASSLIAEGFQSLNISALFGNTIGNSLKFFADSLSNGIINSFFMLRIGFLTDEYIFSEDLKGKKINILNSATVRATALLPKLLSNLITDPIKSIGKAIFKPSSPKSREDEDGNILIDLDQKWTKSKN